MMAGFDGSTSYPPRANRSILPVTPMNIISLPYAQRFVRLLPTTTALLCAFVYAALAFG